MNNNLANIDNELFNNYNITCVFDPIYNFVYKDVNYQVIRPSYWEYPNQIEELCKEAIEFEEEFSEQIRIIFVNLKDFDELVTSGYLKKIIEIWGHVIHKADVVFAPVKCVNKCVTSKKHILNIDEHTNDIIEIEDLSLCEDEYKYSYKHTCSHEESDNYEHSCSYEDNENLHEEEKLRKKFNKRFGLIEFLKEHIVIPFMFMILGITFQIQVHHKKIIHIMVVLILIMIALVWNLMM